MRIDLCQLSINLLFSQHDSSDQRERANVIRAVARFAAAVPHYAAFWSQEPLCYSGYRLLKRPEGKFCEQD
ncbi:hypothetical protein Poly41_57370 [Novipirellula artificiosorum]|uniref:Uncharacterized protein n=1 Tax=Novipirellula artificiosorum TaxID=2528016 RepID=A0A5C6D5L8_9BACT|nr:hypothetical protein Poly41_57370 [Novipirellula artificiosorum]